MTISLSAAQLRRLQLNGAVETPERHSPAPKPPRGSGNLDHLLARAARAGWCRLSSADGVTYELRHVDGRRIAGAYAAVLRQAANTDGEP